MQYKKLGRTGIRVSPFCLGTMTFGSQIDEVQSISVIKGAIDLGINFFDTADIYNNGKSEDILGTALKGTRNSAVIATKVGGACGKGPNDRGLSRKNILLTVEDSLRRLKTDYIDLYYVHFPDFNTPIEETLIALNDLVRQGKVLYIGCSNFTGWQLSDALRASERQSLARFECIESPYNLLTRDIEMELLPLCDNEAVSVCVFNPLAGEMLTGRHEFGKPPAEGRFTMKDFGKGYLDRYWSDLNFKAVDVLKQAARDRNCTLPQFALGWILNNKSITSFLSGSISIDQVKENAVAVDIKLTPEEIKICDEVWSWFRPERFFYGVDGRLRKPNP